MVRPQYLSYNGGMNNTHTPQSPEALVQIMDPLPISPGLAAAADKLEAVALQAGWFPPTTKPWREMDPIGRNEFLAVVESIVKAHNNAPDGPDLVIQPDYSNA